MRENEKEKLLCQIYELFFEKELEINNPKTVLEIHSMMRFLYHYGISLLNGGFSINSTLLKFPYNENIQELIDNIKTSGQEKLEKVNIELNKKVIIIIKIASDELHKKAMETGYEFSDFIVSVSKIIHVNEQVLPQAEGNKISELDYIEEDEKTINSVLSLVKNIDKEVEKSLQKNEKDNL